MIRQNTGVALSGALAVACGANAAFEGPYAPKHWTLMSEAGGAIGTFTTDQLVLFAGPLWTTEPTDLVVTAAATGAWTFDWTFYGGDCTLGISTAYFLINDTATLLVTDVDCYMHHGSTTVNVQAGDVIGFRIQKEVIDIGQPMLIITNFSAPVPGPAPLALLLPLVGVRRRSRYDGSDGQ